VCLCVVERCSKQMQQQYKRLDGFMHNVEERLGGLEAAVSQLVLSNPDVATRLEAFSHREEERGGSSLYPAASKDKGGASSKPQQKKKKKKAITVENDRDLGRITTPELGYRPMPQPAGDEVDEELARKLQAQFNAEAEIEALKRDSIALSDEDYAQKLQSLYLKRDAAAPANQTSKRTPTSAADKDDQKKKTDSTKPEEKSLWNRLFGAPKADSEADSENEAKPTKKDKATEVATIYPMNASSRPSSVGAPGTGSGTASSGQQLMALPCYYPGMPQQPFVFPAQGMPQYAPYPLTLQPGAQYLYPTSPTSAVAQPQERS